MGSPVSPLVYTMRTVAVAVAAPSAISTSGCVTTDQLESPLGQCSPFCVYTNEPSHEHVFLTNTDRTAALAPWLEHYNTGRRHSALGGHPPITRPAPT